MSAIRPLEPVSLCGVRTFVYPSQQKLDLESPAVDFMTDFIRMHPVVVDDNTEIDAALRIMKESHVRLLLVTRTGNHEFAGIVSSMDLMGGKVLAFMASNQINHRDEVLVKHVMTDREHIHGLDFEKVQRSSIGKVLDTIKYLNEQHILVVDKLLSSYRVRGLFSTTDIAKALHIQFDVEPHAKTFFELEQVVLHHQLVS